MSNVHPTALISPEAKIGYGVEIGPFCIVESGVVLGDRVKLHSNVIVKGNTEIGEGTEVFSYAVIGDRPQMRRDFYEGKLVIGKNNRIREHVTIHTGIESDDHTTRIGDDNYLMVGCHVGHDCILGNGIQMANHVSLGGLVNVGDCVVIGGLTAIHQKVHIGAYAMISGTAGVAEDVIPFGMVVAMKGRLAGLNLIGMKRRGFSRDEIHNMRAAYKILAKGGEDNFSDRIKQIRESDLVKSDAVASMIQFIDSSRQDRHLSLPSEDWDFENAEDVYKNITQVSVA